MTGDPVAQDDEPIASLLAVLDDPSAGRRRLPRLVGLLDADEQSVRVGAAWATCHVAATLPDTVEYLTRRLVDRVASEESSIEAELVFEYVASQYPDVVAEELDAMEDEERKRPRFTPIQGSLARADYHRPERGSRDVGRTRLAVDGEAAGPQRIHTDDDGAHERRGRSSDDGSDATDSEDGVRFDAGGDGEDTVSGDAGRETSRDRGSSGDGIRESGDVFSAIASRSRFDQLTVLAKRRRGRYADVYRTLAVVDGERLPVGLALYHRPPEHGAEFATAIEERLRRWAGVPDHQNVVGVHDWGVEPQPWAATEYTGHRLAGRDELDAAEALWNARELSGALASVHENGVVHGGIDPGNVVYYGNVIDEDEYQPPLLDNVGLLHVVRDYFDPTSRLDPRYAAPEYFDRRFGRIDHATDVYHLGAVLYALFTGRPPYDGDYDRIRERVLSDPAPRPSDVVDVPPGIDDVVTKSMSRRKLRRYETITHMRQELRGIGDALDDNDR